MIVQKFVPGFLGLAMILSLGTPVEAQTLTPQQQAAIQQILKEHNEKATRIRTAMKRTAGDYLRDVSQVVRPGQEPRFEAFKKQFAKANAVSAKQFDSLPAPKQTADVASKILASNLGPVVGSFLNDLGVPAPIRQRVGQRTAHYCHDMGPLMAALARLRRQTKAKIDAVIGTP